MAHLFFLFEMGHIGAEDNHVVTTLESIVEMDQKLGHFAIFYRSEIT